MNVTPDPDAQHRSGRVISLIGLLDLVVGVLTFVASWNPDPLLPSWQPGLRYAAVGLAVAGLVVFLLGVSLTRRAERR